MILWYRQQTGHSHLNLIGYVYATSQSIEDAFKGHFEVSGDGSVESELHVLKLRQPEDSAMYFCAASRHAQRRLSHRPSPLQPFILYEALQSPSDIMDVIIFKHSVLTVSIFLLCTTGLLTEAMSPRLTCSRRQRLYFCAVSQHSDTHSGGG
ncbi:hypothetical protein KUCAC02_026555 [Chaenocephalus aceratus]|nr:hypothetical protein KUCAC02_026555 [Chaenocephalus aceratus]